MKYTSTSPSLNELIAGFKLLKTGTKIVVGLLILVPLSFVKQPVSVTKSVVPVNMIQTTNKQNLQEKYEENMFSCLHIRKQNPTASNICRYRANKIAFEQGLISQAQLSQSGNRDVRDYDKRNIWTQTEAERQRDAADFLGL